MEAAPGALGPAAASEQEVLSPRVARMGRREFLTLPFAILVAAHSRNSRNSRLRLGYGFAT